MKKIILLSIISLALLSSCEEQEFEFAVNYNESASYVINGSGSFTETATFTLDETLDAMDIPDDAVIEGIYIQSLTLEGQALPGNEATGVTLQGTLTYGGNTINLFNSNSFEISNNEIAQIGLTNFNPQAISTLAQIIAISFYDYLSDDLRDGIDPLGSTTFEVFVEGIPTPEPSAMVNINLDVAISFDIGFSSSFEVPFFMGGE